MKAVDSEYNMSLQSDDWRKFMLIQTLSHEESALHRFNCGNLETLKQEGIRENLVKFHKEWYSSNIMKLCLSSQLSLEKLEELANGFLKVDNKNVERPDYSKPCMPFSKENLGQYVKYVPVKDKD
jgi:insulysin